MSDYVVLVADHNFENLETERRAFEGIARVEELGDAADEAAALARADAVLVRMHDLGADRVAQMDNCRVISRYGIGVDHIDVETATEKGIYVANAPTYCMEEVSLHTVALLLNFARRLSEYDDLMAAGGWKSVDMFAESPIHRFSEQTVGVVGFGRIGRTVGEKITALGGSVVVADPYLDAGDLADVDAELVDFDDLLAQSDYVTVHSPLTDETRGLFDADAFAAMKDTAILVNASRGPIVDTDALVDALDAGELAGAGIDVYPEEPPAETDPIRGHDRVVATPHVAYYSEQADVERREQAIENVRAALDGERPPFALNDV